MGSSVAVRITISEGDDVASVPFHVIFNPAVLSFMTAEEGSLLAGGGPTAFFAAPTNSGNEVVVGLSQLGERPGVNGSGVLCVLHFTVIGPGSADLRFDHAKVRDSANQIVTADFESAELVSYLPGHEE